MKVQICSAIYFYSIMFVIMICLLSKGCIPNSDSSEDLSGHYFYRDEGKHVKDILCHSPNHQEIYSEVIAYAYDSDFIVAAQSPNYMEYKNMISFNLRDDLRKYPTNSNEEILKSEEIADSILKNDSYYKKIFSNKINYWIIDHKRNFFLGPLTFKEYKHKFKELDIPRSLELKLD